MTARRARVKRRQNAAIRQWARANPMRWSMRPDPNPPWHLTGESGWTLTEEERLTLYGDPTAEAPRGAIYGGGA